jgi:hypothetical protein
MLKLKSFKEKLLQPYSEKYPLPHNNSKSSSISADNAVLDERKVTILTQWLDRLNREHLISITDQNDIVIMPGGKNEPAQQIFINYDDISAYMEAKTGGNKSHSENGIINMVDIARILLQYKYVNESSGQLSFETYTIALDSDEMSWLISIVRDARPDPQSGETLVNLFDGENTQLIRIPYKHMAPTEDARTVAAYLFRNGQVRYDVDTGTYAYRYVEPDILLDEKTNSPERIRQHYMLSFHIRRIYVDEQNKSVELEFLHEPNQPLVLPASWYHQASVHHFDRSYIIDILLANGGIIDRDTFVFMDRVYSLQEPHNITFNSALTPSTILRMVNLSPRQKYDLIRHYINLIIKKNGTKQHETSRLIVLENPTDGRQLYFTSEDSQYIRKNQFRRQDVIDVLFNYGQIKQDQSGHWLLYYNNQYMQLPPSLIPSPISSSQFMSNLTQSPDRQVSLSQITAITADDTQVEFIKLYHSIIDYMCRHGLVTWDKELKLIRLHFTDQTLLIPLNHLRSIVDPRVASSSSTIDGVLPFSSRQLSEWLINNSYIKP